MKNKEDWSALESYKFVDDWFDEEDIIVTKNKKKLIEDTGKSIIIRKNTIWFTGRIFSKRFYWRLDVNKVMCIEILGE